LVGRLALQSTPLQIAQALEMCMMVYAPVPGTETAAKLQRLMSLDAVADRSADRSAVLSDTAHRDALS